jgi:hypothetical protein
MKVICVNDLPTKYPIGIEGPENKILTKGKSYDVINITPNKDYYIIVSDNGKVTTVANNRFITIDEWREQKLNKILNGIT